MKIVKTTSNNKKIIQPRQMGGELALLAHIQNRTENDARRSRRWGVRLGIGDDCALLRLKASDELAVTTDLSIQGRHFRLDWHPPESVGHRALARGLSDLASMGAKPVAAFLSLGLPRNLTMSNGRKPAWVDRFYDGLLALAEQYDVPLAGGDLAESPLAIADIVLTGAVPKGQALLRSGARPGDRIYVTGSLGGAAAELEELGRSPARFLKSRAAGDNHPHLFPKPRVEQGLWLQKKGLASAAIDLSDGISTDLHHLCEKSGVGAELDAAAIPIGPDATLAHALHGGEDYELLFTSRPEARIPRRIAGVSITLVGQMVKVRRNGVRIMLRTATSLEPLQAQGWEHFSAQDREC